MSWKNLLNNRIFTGHPRANGTRRITNGRNNISAVKDQVDMLNIQAFPRDLIESIGLANQHLAEGKRLDRLGREADARQHYTESAQLYKKILYQLMYHRIQYPTISDININNPPPGTQRARFNYAVRRARETGGEAAAAAVIAAAHAASEELSRATAARIPTLQAAHARLAHADVLSQNAAQREVNRAFRELYGSNRNRNAPRRAAYNTAEPFVRAAEAAPRAANKTAKSHDINADRRNYHARLVRENRNDMNFVDRSPYVLGLPPDQPRVTLFPFGPPASAPAPAPLDPTGSLFVSGVAKRGGKKTRRKVKN